MCIVLLHAHSADGHRLVFERQVDDPATVVSELPQFRVVSESRQRVLLDSPAPLRERATELTSRFDGWRLLSHL